MNTYKVGDKIRAFDAFVLTERDDLPVDAPERIGFVDGALGFLIDDGEDGFHRFATQVIAIVRERGRRGSRDPSLNPRKFIRALMAGIGVTSIAAFADALQRDEERWVVRHPSYGYCTAFERDSLKHFSPWREGRRGLGSSKVRALIQACSHAPPTAPFQHRSFDQQALSEAASLRLHQALDREELCGRLGHLVKDEVRGDRDVGRDDLPALLMNANVLASEIWNKKHDVEHVMLLSAYRRASHPWLASFLASASKAVWLTPAKLV